MVPDPRATPGPGAVRPLNRPVPARVREGEDGLPAAVRLPRGWTPVVQVLERWRIDDAWWREAPISRVYHRLVLRDGRQLVLYRDLITGGWYRQRDG